MLAIVGTIPPPHTERFDGTTVAHAVGRAVGGEVAVSRAGQQKTVGTEEIGSLNVRTKPGYMFPSTVYRWVHVASCPTLINLDQFARRPKVAATKTLVAIAVPAGNAQGGDRFVHHGRVENELKASMQ